MTSRLLLAALCLCLLVPTVSAAVTLDGQLQASTLQAQDGTLRGSLLAFGQEYVKENALVPAGWHLTAGTLAQQADHTDAAVGDRTFRSEPTTSPTAYYSTAVVDGSTVQAGFRFLVFPMTGVAPTLTATVACQDVVPTDQGRFVREPSVQNSRSRTNLSADVGQAVLWTPCATGATVTISGDFCLILYGMDANLSANGQNTTLPSGEHAKAPGPVDTTSALATADEQYLYAWNAVLTVPLGAHPEAYLAGAHLGAPALTLQDATGRLAGALDVQAHDLQLTGTLTADVRGQQGAPVTAHVGGQADRVLADGATLTLTTTATAGSTWWAVAVVALLAAGGLAAFGARAVIQRRRARAMLGPALGLIRRNSADEILERANRALALDPRFGLAYSVRAFAQQRRDPASALADYQRAIRFLPPGGDRDVAMQRARDVARQLGAPDPRRP